MRLNNGRKERKSDMKKKHIVLLILLILLIAIAGVLIGLKLADKPETSTSNGGVGLQVDSNAGEYVEPETENASPSQGVAIPGWGTITIPANQTDVVVDFFNPEANEGLYYLTFELRLLDDSEQGYEVLYTSGLVEPGLHIQEIALSRGLDSGTYETIIHVQPYRMDEARTPTNNADMKTELVVK